MPHNQPGILQMVIDSLQAMALGAFAGMVSLFRKNASQVSWWIVVGGMFTSVFVAFLISIISKEYGISDTWRTVAIALGAYGSRDLLDMANKKFLSIAKGKLDE